METKEKSEKLRLWQQRLSHSETAYQKQLNKMDGREKQYLGDRVLRPLTENDTSKCGKKETPHVRNITAELIEAQVSSDIPQPKVTARRKEDEPLAKIIEDMLRNELDRLPMEYINDMQERTVPIQGGSFYHVEWDNRQRTHNTTGEVAVAARHPKQVIPQEGVYTALEDMDYIILRLPTTKERVKAVYGVDISDEGEELPELRGSDGESPADEMVTMYVGYAHNGKGGISKYAWVRDTELEDLEDYQARRLRRCRQCGEVEPREGDVVVDRQELVLPGTVEEALFGGGPQVVEQSHIWHEGDPCPYCGGTKWEWRDEEYEELWDPVQTAHGKVIPGQREEIGEDGTITYQPTKIPYYKPSGEKMTGMTAFEGFQPVGENGAYPEDETQEGYDKTIVHETWKDSFSISREAVDDSKLVDFKKKPQGFIKGYHRTRELFGAALYAGAIGGKTKVTFRGKSYPVTTADGKKLFATDHPSILGKGSQSNVFADAFSADSLGAAETRMQQFKGDADNILDVSPTTILIPNDYKAKKAVFEAIGADKDPATANNAFNYQFGRWNVICWTYLNQFLSAYTDFPWVLLDEAYNEAYGGAVWFDRVKLEVRSELAGNDANVWKGYARWSAGFNDWRFACCGGISGGTQLIPTGVGG